MAAAGDYLAYATSRNLCITPCSPDTIIGCLYARFAMGHTARSIPSTLTKLKYFYRNVLQRKWLSPIGKQTLDDAKKAMQKFDFTVATKALPLTIHHLQLIQTLSMTPAEKVVFAAWTLAYQAMARLGELTNSKVHKESLVHDVNGAFYVYFYRKPPKSHKTTPAPYAVCSKNRSPFTYWVLRQYMLQFHAHSRPSSPLFPAVQNNMMSYGGAHLSSQHAIPILQSWLQRLKIPDSQKYTGHSARRGAYNDAGARQIPERHMCAQGHWNPASSAAKMEYSVESLVDRLKYF